MTPAGLQRRFVLLTSLRWVPTGLVVPVTVLLMASRGLSPADIGLVFVVHGAVVVALELPTGGLADAVGRRAVLAAGGLLHLGGLLALSQAEDLRGFCTAYLLVAVGRALDSGPLEAWYVDSATALDPDADTTVGLSRAGVADGLALAAGAALGGALPALLGERLSLPFLLAAVGAGVQVLAVLLLVVPVAPAPRRTARQALRAGVADVPRTVGTAVRLGGRDEVLRTVLLLAFGTGVVLVTLELLSPLLFADLAGGGTEGASAYGVVIAVAFAAAGLGSALAPRVRDLLGSPGRAMAVLSVVCAVAVTATGSAGTVLLAGSAYCAFYLSNGASWPLRKRFLHDRVSSGQRATMVSAGSLAVQLGGITGDLLVPRLAEAAGTAEAFAAAGGVLLVMAALSLRLRAPARVEVPA